MNTIREALDKLQRAGVGYITGENICEIRYKIDDKTISIKVIEGD